MITPPPGAPGDPATTADVPATTAAAPAAGDDHPTAPRTETVLVVPCYNEAARLPVHEYVEFLEAHGGIGFLFVDDGSTDRTRARLEEIAEGGGERVGVLALPRNLGKAEAVRRGLLVAPGGGARFVGYWDADLATPLESAIAFRRVLRERPEVRWVLGSRVRLLGRSIERGALRHYLGRIFATVASLVLRLPVYDTQCGAKLFRADEGLAELLREPFVSRWAFDVELLARFAVRHGGAAPEIGRRVVEVPLERWSDVEGSKLGLRAGARAFWDLSRIRGRYPR